MAVCSAIRCLHFTGSFDPRLTLRLRGGVFRYTVIVGPLGRIRQRVFRSVNCDHHPLAVTRKTDKSLLGPSSPSGPWSVASRDHAPSLA